MRISWYINCNMRKTYSLLARILCDMSTFDLITVFILRLEGDVAVRVGITRVHHIPGCG